MFGRSYPRARITHVRVLQSHGTPRGLAIVPVPGPALEPPEIVHPNSTVIYSLKPGIMYVLEWTGGQTELHYVFL